jgi:cytochrome c oxidase assembly factor CtaG
MDPTLTAFLASWHWRPDVALVVTGLGALYVTGWGRLRRRRPRAVTAGQLVLYLTGLVVIILALLSPLDTFASWLLMMHMLQHELLTMVAPPLLLLANPLPVILWGTPQGLRHRLGRLLTRGARVRRALRALTLMPVTWGLFMLLLWGWHLPAAYQAALQYEVLHDVQHLSFFAAGLLFWWPLINPAPRVHGHIAYGFRLAYILAAVGPTMVPFMSIAFFAREVFYPHYLAAPRLWGLTALEDQTTGWALMGVLDGMIYLTAFLLLVARMLEHEERMTRVREAIDLKLREARLQRTSQTK